MSVKFNTCDRPVTAKWIKLSDQYRNGLSERRGTCTLKLQRTLYMEMSF